MKRLFLLAVIAIAVSLRADEKPYRYNVIVRMGDPRVVNALVYGAGDALLLDETSQLFADKPLTFSKTSDGVTFTIRVIPVMSGEVLTTFVAQRGNAVVQRQEELIPSGRVASDDELIKIKLKDADLRDVLNTFATLTGRTITADPSATGSVTVDVEDVSWQVGLTRAVAPLGLLPKMQADGSIVLLRMPQ